MLKNNKKLKAMANIMPVMGHYPRKGKTGDWITNLLCHINPVNK